MLAGVSYGVAKRTLGEQAYETIREAILTLQVKPGQTVFESDFTRMLHMSRTPVREAIRALVLEDLIEVLPQRGMKVTRISLRRVEESRFVRESLELSAIREIVQGIDVNSDGALNLRRDLDASLRLQRDALGEQDPMRFLAADDQFHRSLLRYFGNAPLVLIVGQIRGYLNRVRMLSLHDMPTIESLIGEHEAIVHGVFERDVDTVTHVLRKHLGRVTEDISAIQAKHPDYFTT